MTFAIRHRGLESPEIAWRRKLRYDSLKLGQELHGKGARRLDMDAQRIAAGIIRPHEARHFRRVEEYVSLRAELPKSFRNGMTLAQAGPISEITNFNTSVTYATICDALYHASTGDEIILPAGSGATHSATFRRYSYYTQLDSQAAGYTNGSDAMVFGNPAHSSSSATYLSVVGIASSNNLSSVAWASTAGGQLTLTISGSPITTYRRGQYVRISGATNTGTGGAIPGKLLSINNTFPLISASGGTLVASAPASSGVYGTVGGSPVLNNDRAQISPPIGYLTAPLNPGDTTITLDDATDFKVAGSSCYAWGNGNGTWQSIQMDFSGVSGNTLTGVSGSGGLASQVPIGTPIVQIMYGGKAILTPAATNPTGITLSNLELWAASAYPSGGGIFMWVAEQGQQYGNTTLNNMFLHDCFMGIRPGNSSVGAGVFLEVFNSEIWRCGAIGNDKDHNAYVDCDVLTFYNSLSWQSFGVHLIKSRAGVNYALYSRTYRAWGSAANPGGIWSTNFDFPNAGKVYIIGCILEQAEQDSTTIIRYGEETNYPASGLGVNTNMQRGAANPLTEIYIVNSNILAPSNGVGETGAGSIYSNNGAITIGWPGLKSPEVAFLSTVAGGALAARSYWITATLLDGSGNESLPGCMNGFDADPFGPPPVTAQVAVGANQLAVLTSPMARTGAVNYNVWAAHSDPAIWWNSGGMEPPATGATVFFYDSAFTLPVAVANAGGSQPAAFVYIGVTYVFLEGESVNFGVAGMDLRFPSLSPVATGAAVINVPASNLLTIKSPPAKAGATGWYPYVTVIAYKSDGSYNTQTPLSKQVFTPIAIGTDWVQSSAFKMAQTYQYNFYKQNASPVSIGTNWTEPATGLTNLNPNLLKWYQHGSVYDNGLAMSKWFAVATSAYTNYSLNIYNNQQDGNIGGTQMSAAVQVWSGATTPWPFDADYPSASVTNGASATATTAASHTAILAGFRSNGSAGSGWTLGAALSAMTTEYRIVSSPQSSLPVTLTGGGSGYILVTALAQATSLALRGSTLTVADSPTTAGQVTVPSISVGDVLVLDVTIGSGPFLLAVDPLAVGPPAQNQSLNNVSPLGLVVNNISAYYNPTGTPSGYNTGGWIFMLIGGVPVASYPTVSTFNLQVNTFNGTTFAAPLVAAVWTDAPNFDFTLAGGSPAIGAGTNPGSGGGLSLVPTFQTSMIGTPTPGYPIAALTARSDMGVTLGAIGSGAIPPAPGPRMRWLRFGWDWKIVVAIGAVAIVENPTLTRRGVLLLTERATEPRERPGRSDPTGQYGVTSGLRKSHDRPPAESMRHDPRNRETDEP